MTDWVIIEGEYPRLPELLVQEAPGFGASEEFARLDPSDHALPSIVCGAFKNYVERLHAEADTSTTGPDPKLAEAFRAMERLATSHDGQVVNSLIVDVYEHLDMTGELLDAFRSRLGPSSSALYDRWIGPR